jgi:hypothetical protein
MLILEHRYRGEFRLGMLASLLKLARGGVELCGARWVGAEQGGGDGALGGADGALRAHDLRLQGVTFPFLALRVDLHLVGPLGRAQLQPSLPELRIRLGQVGAHLRVSGAGPVAELG